MIQSKILVTKEGIIEGDKVHHIDKKRIPMGIENASMALKEATDLLDKMKIRYFLLFGTALSLYRDNKITDYDWDIDLGMLGEDLDKFNKQMILDNGFIELKIKQDIPKWKKSEIEHSDENYIRTISFKKYDCRIDIDPIYISKDEKNRIILKGRKRERFCALHPVEWFKNFNTVEYKDKQYPIPCFIEDYLKSNYGKTWNIPQYIVMPWSKRQCMSQVYECK